MDGCSSCGNPPAVLVAVTRSAIDTNEFGLRTSRLERFRDPLTLRDINVVVTCSMDREKRNVGPCERDRGDVAELGIGPGSRMAENVSQNIVEVGHHLLRWHRHIVLAIEVDGDTHSPVRARWIVAERNHRREVTTGGHAERGNSRWIYSKLTRMGSNVFQRRLNVFD